MQNGSVKYRRAFLGLCKNLIVSIYVFRIINISRLRGPLIISNKLDDRIQVLRKLIPNRIRAQIRLHLLKSWVLEGRLQGCNALLRVLLGGVAPPDKAYIAKRLFDSDVREYYKGRKMRWKTAAYAQQFDCELSITPTGGFAGYSRSDSYEYLIPKWVAAEVALTKEDVEEGRSKSRRRDLRQLEKNGLRYELTTDKQDLISFYDDMYLPTMMSSHGEGAVFWRRDQILQRVEDGKCELLIVTQKQQRIAGSLIAYDGDIPRLWGSGIRAADRRFLRLGAGNAVYLFSFQHLLKSGYRRVNIGLSRAFLSDGALYFKKRLGISLTNASEEVFAIRFDRPSTALRSCLSANPFVFVEGSALHAAVFVSSDYLRDDASWRAIWDTNHLPGIEKLIVNAFHDTRTASEISVPRNLSSQIGLRCIDIDPVRGSDAK